jgi:rare lipoprotein A
MGTMPVFARAPALDIKKFKLFLLASVLGAALSGCSSQMASRGFSPSEYGVPASERVVAMGQPVPKGGGVYRVGKPYQVRGLWYYPKENPAGYQATGIASWYGDDFHGRRTANGEVYNMYALSAAHPTLPLPSYARVTNVANGRSVVVRVNDRGPFHSGRVIDLSKRASLLLDMHGAGLGKVKVAYMGKAKLDGNDDAWLVSQVRDNGRAMPRQMVASLAPVPAWAQADVNDVRVALADVLQPEERLQPSYSYRVASLQPVAPPVAEDERIGIEALRADTEEGPTQSMVAASAPLALLPASTASTPAGKAVARIAKRVHN